MHKVSLQEPEQQVWGCGFFFLRSHSTPATTPKGLHSFIFQAKMDQSMEEEFEDAVDVRNTPSQDCEACLVLEFVE